MLLHFQFFLKCGFVAQLGSGIQYVIFFSFAMFFSHHPRAGIWERLQALGNIHLNIHLCVVFFFFFSFFFFLFVIYLLSSFLLLSYLSFPLFSAWSCECSTHSYMVSLEPCSSRPPKKTQRIALFLAVFVCSTARREKSIIHEALEALPERRICTSAIGFNGTIGGI